MSSNNMDASCHTTLYRVKWPWLDISCSRDQDQTNVASVGVLGICGRVGGSCMVLPLLFTIFAFGLVEEEERQQGTSLSPCWSLLDFWKIKFEKSSSTNWIFNLQKSISKLIFASYTGSKYPVWNRLKIQFVELDFSNLIFQKSSTDG